VLGELGPEPAILQGAHPPVAVAVQHEDAPAPRIVGVVAPPVRTRVGAEVLEVRPRSAGMMVVVAQGRPCARPVPAPRGCIALGEIPGGPMGICVVAERENDRVGEVVEQAPRGLVPATGAAANIPRADQFCAGRRR
jgi:hypothetical protein